MAENLKVLILCFFIIADVAFAANPQVPLASDTADSTTNKVDLYPFASVSVSNKHVVVTMPDVGNRWRLKVGTNEVLTSYGQSFVFRSGDKFSMHERHSGYDFSVKIKDGRWYLNYISRFDARSFGQDVKITKGVLKAE